MVGMLGSRGSAVQRAKIGLRLLLLVVAAQAAGSMALAQAASAAGPCGARTMPAWIGAPWAVCHVR